jgi:hypothetical protein
MAWAFLSVSLVWAHPKFPTWSGRVPDTCVGCFDEFRDFASSYKFTVYPQPNGA